MNTKKCYVCGGEMQEKPIEVASKWGDYELVLKGVNAYICQSCGKKMYSADEVGMMQNLTRALSDIEAHKRPSYLNLEETAQILRVSNQTVYNMIKDGRIKAYKVGREWRFLESDIKAGILNKNLANELEIAAKGGKIDENDIRIISEEMGEYDVDK